MLVLCITDIKWLVIPNVIVIPAIAWGLILTRHWLPALVIFGIAVIFYQRKTICGGDVKLLAMVGAFLGWWVLPIFVLTGICIAVYRRIKIEFGILPYTPFLGLVSIPFIWIR